MITVISNPNYLVTYGYINNIINTKPRMPTPRMLLETIMLDNGILAFTFLLLPIYIEPTLNDFSIASSPLNRFAGISSF